MVTFGGCFMTLQSETETSGFFAYGHKPAAETQNAKDTMKTEHGNGQPDGVGPVQGAFEATGRKYSRAAEAARGDGARVTTAVPGASVSIH
jgi:hypothetical protein